MADQANPGPVVGVGQEGGALAQTGPDTYQAPEVFHGRTVSWVAVSIIAAGFLADADHGARARLVSHAFCSPPGGRPAPLRPP